MRIAAIALFACALVARADDKDELKKLEGTWDVVALEVAGKEVPKGKGAPEKLVVRGGTMAGFGPEIKLTTDATKKPKWLNMTFTRDGMDRTVNAIYELTGDELKICLPMAPAKGSGKFFENKRPADFEIKDKPEMLIRAKRAKSK
jgi:uncharacterized protein (TIGR03067 family)